VDDQGIPRDYETLAINAACERMIGRSVSDLVGKTLRDLHPDPSPVLVDRIRVFGGVALNGGTERIDILDDQGRKLHVDVSSDGDGYFVVGYTLITEASDRHGDFLGHDSDFEMFFDLSNNLLCLFDLNGRLLKYNRSWKHILGYGPKELMDKGYQAAIHPDDRAVVSAMFERLKEIGKVNDFVCRFRDEDGRYKTFEWRAYVREGTVYAIAQDITGRLMTNGLLQESEEKFKQIFINAPLGLFHYTPEGVITECNDGFVKSIGSSHEKLVGLNMFKLPDERVKEALRKSFDRLETIHLEIEYESYTARKKTPVRLIFAPMVSNEGTAIGGIGIVEDISERVQAQKALLESKASYQALFEQAADGVLIGIDNGTIIDANENMTRITGYTKNELIGANITKLFSQDTLRAKPLDFQSLHDGKIIFVTREITCKDDSRATIEMKTKKLADGRLFSSMRDVTPLKKAEEALRASEDRLNRLFELNPYSILITDDKGCPLRINRAFHTMFGSGPVPGIPVFDHPVIASLGIADEMKKALNGETIHIPDYCLTLPGKPPKTLWMRMVVFPVLNRMGKVEMLVMMHEDVTEQYVLREKLRHAEKMEAIGVLTGGIAHDFNNMLSGIIGGATMLGRHDLTDDARRSLKLITESAERMADLTGKLLTFGRKDSQAFRPIDIHAVIGTAIEILNYSIDKKVAIVCDLKGEGLLVSGSESQLQNVFINLGINASHAMPGGGTLTFRTSLVGIDDAYLKNLPSEILSEPYVKIEVIDTGTGIPLEYQGKIFEPFFTTKKIDQGAGLGLATVYGTITEHRGLVDFSSEPNQGTTFTIYLPQLRDVFPQTQSAQAAIERGSGRVLLVEDEAIVREATQDMLEALGYTVITAENGQEGLDVFVAEQNTIDLVILDMMMPKMNGKDCFRKIKALSPSTRVIIYSGYTDMDDVAELEKDGLNAFMKKPFSFAELSRVLKSCGS
jgi:PAS domain S-box-containing protein